MSGPLECPASPTRRFAQTVLLVVAAALFVLGGCSGPGARPPANFNPPCAGAEGAIPAPAPGDRAAVRAVLRRQARAWSRGDLAGYMAGYAQTDTLRFASGGNVHTGWETTLENYRERYPDREAMGTLSFSNVDVDALSGRHALAFGRWHLTREAGAGGAAGGLFTLLFEKVPTGEGRHWRIVYDHTSSD